MPGIRDENWFLSPSFKEGTDALLQGHGETKDVRFSGLLLGQDTLGKDEMNLIVKSFERSKAKSFCLDWFDVEEKSFCEIENLADLEDQAFNLDSFHLTMIDLSNRTMLSSVSRIVETNRPIVDLILTFCRINCGNVDILGSALEKNTTILSLNLNFNLLHKAGYLTLATSLLKNTTLRYLEAKLNKAEKDDLLAFTEAISENQILEYVDVGQEDDIDGVIKTNNVKDIPKPAKQIARKETKTVDVPEPIREPLVEGAVAVAVVPPPAVNTQPPGNLLLLLKDFTLRNKTRRLAAEEVLKTGQLLEILEKETGLIQASLKHCKIMTLGDKGSGKTFFSHCLVHQLYQKNDNTPKSEVSRKLKTTSLARVTELGWTKISDFHHVKMILAKRLSTLEVNVRNREKANEVSFQFPEQVVISDKDLKAETTFMDVEDKELLKKLKLDEVKKQAAVPVFSAAEKAEIVADFGENVNALIDKALRENNYPSFSIWDLDKGPGYDETFRFFFNDHGMIYIFFNLEDVKTNPQKIFDSIEKYLRPIRHAKERNSQVTSKVFLVGTFLDTVLNVGLDAKVEVWLSKFEKSKKKGVLTDTVRSGHLDFIIKNQKKEESRRAAKAVKKMLQAFNVELSERFQNEFGKELVPNDPDDLMFFPLSNNLPVMCKEFKHDFDDISGINLFRKKVRSLIDNKEIAVISVMKTLRDAKIIDKIITRKNTPPATVKDKSASYILQADFEALAESAGVTSRAEIALLLRYMDVTGIVTWISDSATLQNVIVLNPDYISSGLKNFYTVLSPGESDISEFEKNMVAEAKGHGLSVDIENMKQKRVVSGDLLIEKLLSRDNFDYFVEFLSRCFHLNKIDVTALKKVFKKQNLCSLKAADDIYLVPDFSTAVQKATTQLDKLEFLPYKVKFVPVTDFYPTGSFERTFTSLVNSMTLEIVKEVENVLEYSQLCAKFTLGNSVFTMAEVKGLDKEKNGVIQFEFNEKAASMYFDYIERVIRNGQLSTHCYIMDKNKWISMAEAQEIKLSPYFKDAPVNSSLNVESLTAAFDNL